MERSAIGSACYLVLSLNILFNPGENPNRKEKVGGKRIGKSIPGFKFAMYFNFLNYEQ